jgi:hypothetical protein
MKKGTSLSTDAIFGIIIGLAFFVGMGLFAFMIPGFLGKAIGLISGGLFAIANTFWGLIGQFLKPIINAVRDALGASLITTITMSCIGAVTSFMAAYAARSIAQTAAEALPLTATHITRWGLTAGWNALKSGLVSGFKGALNAGMYTLVAYLLSDLVVVPFVSQYLGPVAGTGVGGGIKGGVTGWFLGGSIAHLLGASVGNSLGLGAGLTSGIVSSLVKNYSGLTGAAGALATIGSGVASGAAIGFLFGGPVGAAVGGIVGGIVGAFNWFF